MAADPHDPHTLFDADGNELPGYLVATLPPAVIIVHEVFGLNEQIRGVARRYAADGFTTFAVDLFGGRVTRDMASGIRTAQLMSWKTAVQQIREAAAALVARARGPAKVGVLGFSFGGGVALAAAAQIPELSACVTFYGIPTNERADVNRIGCRVQGHFARFDKHVSNDRVDAFESRLQAAGVGAEIHRYHAEHAFFNETIKESHSASNTELSFRRSAAFMRKELTGSY
jgi:carboxymethylenebutenolidase